MSEIQQTLFECLLCTAKTVIETNPEEYVCLCQRKPRGLSTYHICGECRSSWWGHKNDDICVNCEAKKLGKFGKNLDNFRVGYEKFGSKEWIEAKRDSPQERQEREIKNQERLQEAIEKKIQLEKAKEDAILQTPILLNKLIEKLDQFMESKK